MVWGLRSSHPIRSARNCCATFSAEQQAWSGATQKMLVAMKATWKISLKKIATTWSCWDSIFVRVPKGCNGSYVNLKLKCIHIFFFLFTDIWRFPKMVGFPNNPMGWTLLKMISTWGVKWGYHHLRKHPYMQHCIVDHDRLAVPIPSSHPTLGCACTCCLDLTTICGGCNDMVI